MKNQWRVLCPFVCSWSIAVVAFAGDVPAAAIDYRDLASGRAVVMGALGVPLGTLVTAEVEVVSVPTLFFGKTDGGYYRLRVHAVNGTPLANPPELPFHVWASRIAESGSLVNAPSELLSDQQKARRLSPEFDAEARRTVEEGYAGSRHLVIVHEQAAFGGSPQNRPDAVGSIICGMRAFEFTTHLMVGVEDVRTRLAFKRWRSILASQHETPLPAGEGALQTYLVRAFGGHLNREITTDPRAAAAQFRAAILAEARGLGWNIVALEKCLAACERRPLVAGVERILAGAYAVTTSDGPGWAVVVNGFQSAAALPANATDRRIPRFGSVEWSTVCSEEFVLLRASDAAVLVEVPLDPNEEIERPVSFGP